MINQLATADEYSDAMSDLEDYKDEYYKENHLMYLMPYGYGWSKFFPEFLVARKDTSTLRRSSKTTEEATSILTNALYHKYKELCVDPALYVIYYSAIDKRDNLDFKENITCDSCCNIMCDVEKDVQKYFDKYYIKKTKTRIAILPKILVINIANEKDKHMQSVKCQEQLNLKDFTGNKKYRLISTVCETSSTGGHFVAEVNTTDGWVEVDGSPESVKEIQFHETRPYGSKDNRYRDLLIYELVE